ncbi:PfkB family carbohydrate kinase [Opitutus terrae]|uniref:PfkB domain protein n=1 Tax=Opitutus terrae (strain DSM 11246 / JCM 15787 / PB90-1) TaxID=452637 RepID=B1ZT98_OPITP|nr:PfkB family carbohydrate kinase [Opitutus terrae]ACB76552.1 PfkB domain protein [Opitutus terrae PB90-1]
MTDARKKSAARPGAASKAPAVVCFGEVLWDCLPRGLFLGGAPINAAYHLSRQGLRALPVTTVGNDFLGEEARRRIAAWGLDVTFVGVDRQRPTGTVSAVLDAAGQAHYEIARHVAWDRIEASGRLRRVSPAPAAIVHGTLALREPPNRLALATLWRTWPDAWRVVDLNFRSPFDTAALSAFALRHAQFVKLNDEELVRLTPGRGHDPAALARRARAFAEHHEIPRVCVTAGSRGAGLWWEGAWFWEDARPVQVRDTVGAGDAFLGGFLGAWLGRGASPERALATAARVGEFVAGCDGATPDYRVDAAGRPLRGRSDAADR